MFNTLKTIFLIFCLCFSFSVGAKIRDQYLRVVKLHLTLQSQDVAFGSAVFIDSNILVTAAHNLYQLKEPIEKNLFFKDPKTNSLIPITKILHLNLEYDLAVLETGDYYSDTFYSIPEEPHPNVLDEIKIVGFPLGRFNSMKGHILEHREQFITTSVLFFGKLNGTSGGAVFNIETDTLIGIVVRNLALPSTMQFVSTTQVKSLLSKTPLSCSFTDCFNNQLTALISEAEKGNMVAQYSLAMLYKDHLNTPLAIRWFVRAAESSSVLSKYNLGNYAYIGNEMAQDPVEAINTYKEIGYDFVFAAYRLGVIYLNGVENVPVNYEAGFFWMEIAAEKHFFQAEYYLGMLYYNAQGTVKDFDEAFYWVKRAADKGYSRAELQVAIMYHFGEGVEEPNNDLAIIWAEKAAQQGLTEAKIVLRILSENN